MLEKTRSRSLIKRTKSKALNRRRKFKAHENPLKTYQAKHTPEETLAFAQKCRRERLCNPTEAEQSFASIIRRLGVAFEREAIFINGDRPILIDFLFRKSLLAMEIDGSAHDRQRLYDRGRDQWLERQHGIKTIRFTNDEVLRNPEWVKDAMRAVLGE